MEREKIFWTKDFFFGFICLLPFDVAPDIVDDGGAFFGVEALDFCVAAFLLPLMGAATFTLSSTALAPPTAPDFCLRRLSRHSLAAASASFLLFLLLVSVMVYRTDCYRLGYRTDWTGAEA